MTTNIDPVQTFKIVLIGDAGVGKSSFMNRFVHGVYNINYTATIGVDFKVAVVNIGEYKCRLQIWDTAGQERFRAMTTNYYRGADGIIIIYDVTNRASFDEIKSRFTEIDFYSNDIPKILVGNKNEDDNLQNKVISTDDGQEYAKQKNILFYETSVKDNKNITEVFHHIAKLALKQRIHESLEIQKSISLQQQQSIKKNKKNSFCLI